MHSSKPMLPVTRVITLLGFLLLLAGCSSAPDTPEQEVARKNQAARYAESGNTQFNLGNYDLALRYFDLALTENIGVDNLPGIAQAYNSVGRVYLAVGNPAEARASFRQAILFAELADSSEHRIQAHINLGVVALQTDDTAGAREFFDLAQTAINSGNGEPNAILYHSLGTLYAREQQFDRARDYLEQARNLNRKNERWEELASNYYMLSSVASRRQRYDQALSDANQALEYDKRAENSPGIAADLFALGAISENMENYEDAYQYFLRSLRVYLTLNQMQPALSTLSRLEVVATRTNRETEAREFRAQRERIEQALPSRRRGSAAQ